MTRILVTGGAGQLGGELERLAWPENYAVVVPAEEDLDITDPRQVDAAVADLRPDVVINAAAYTAVDRAEDERQEAERANATAVGHIAAAADRGGAALIHISTDYVFDGSADGWYTEEDEPRPLGVYGQTKLAGERTALAAQHGGVLRTSWLYSARGTNFVRTVRDLAASRDSIAIVDDQRGCPTAAADLAAVILEVLQRAGAPRGLFHVAAPDDASWWELAVAAVEMMDPASGSRVERIVAADYPTAARRPANSRLSSEKLFSVYGLRLRPWREALADVSAELNSAKVGS